MITFEITLYFGCAVTFNARSKRTSCWGREKSVKCGKRFSLRECMEIVARGGILKSILDFLLRMYGRGWILQCTSATRRQRSALSGAPWSIVHFMAGGCNSIYLVDRRTKQGHWMFQALLQESNNWQWHSPTKESIRVKLILWFDVMLTSNFEQLSLLHGIIAILNGIF